MAFLLIIVLVVVVVVVYSKTLKQGKCLKCGKGVDGFSGIELSDKSMICNDCFSRVPKYYKEYATNYWKSEDYKDFIKYLDYSNKELLPIFKSTDSYGYLYIDEENGLFLVSHGLLPSDKPNVDHPIFRFRDLMSADFKFEPEKLKEGIFNTTVRGNVYFVYSMGNINIGEVVEIQYDESAHAEQNFFKTKITYGLPEFLKDFEMKFIATYMKFKPNDNSNGHTQDIVAEALNLFMFDSIEEVTHEKLKEQRNRLIKAFHPDENGNIDSKYAAKINNAFKILDERCNI